MQSDASGGSCAACEARFRAKPGGCEASPPPPPPLASPPPPLASLASLILTLTERSWRMRAPVSHRQRQGLAMWHHSQTDLLSLLAGSSSFSHSSPRAVVATATEDERRLGTCQQVCSDQSVLVSELKGLMKNVNSSLLLRGGRGRGSGGGVNEDSGGRGRGHGERKHRAKVKAKITAGSERHTGVLALRKLH
ncbi:uncharacterized protein V6R79_025782 [Siganus canaliculatus]